MGRLRLIGLLVLIHWAAAADEDWPSVLNQMPLGAGPVQLNRTNCAQLLLGGFQSNATGQALIFMRGATDELYFF